MLNNLGFASLGGAIIGYVCNCWCIPVLQEGGGGTWYTGHSSSEEKGAGKELEVLVVVFAVIRLTLCRVPNCNDMRYPRLSEGVYKHPDVRSMSTDPHVTEHREKSGWIDRPCILLRGQKVLLCLYHGASDSKRRHPVIVWEELTWEEFLLEWKHIADSPSDSHTGHRERASNLDPRRQFDSGNKSWEAEREELTRSRTEGRTKRTLCMQRRHRWSPSL